MLRRPRLVALDLDGTVVNSDNIIPPENARAIRALADSGVSIAFLTGRRMRTALPQIEELGLPALVATNSGCIVWDYPSMERVALSLFPQELLLPVAEALAPHSLSFFVADESGNASRAEFLYLEREPNTYYDNSRQYFGERLKSLSDPAELLGREITQLALPHEPEIVESLYAQMQQRFGDSLLSMAVHWPLVQMMALEVFGPGGHKGWALELIAARLGIERGDVLAVGDDANDAAMLQWAGHGAAMPHARPLARAAADEIIPGEGVSALSLLLERALRLAP